MRKTTRTTPVRRRVVALAVAGALGALSLGAAGPVSSAQAQPKKTMCFYYGWFQEDGVWHQGFFLEDC